MESQLYIGDCMSSTVDFIMEIFPVFQDHVLGVTEWERGLEMTDRFLLS